MKKNTKTYYSLILDKSGSMASVVKPTVEGFNEQVRMIKNLAKKYPDQKIRVSLTTFNHNIDEDLFIKKPSELKELQESPHFLTGSNDASKQNGKIIYSPGGSTALYDAIGKTIKKLRKAIKDEIKNNKASAVVVILTDGHENSSGILTYEEFKKMIAKLEKSPNWTISYLGATPDAVDIARKMNIDERNAMYFDKQNMDDVFSECLEPSMNDYMEEKERGRVTKKFLKKKDEPEERKINP